MSDQCPYCNSWHLRTVYNHDDTWSYLCDDCGRQINPEDTYMMEWQEEAI